jgi:PhnB protein
VVHVNLELEGAPLMIGWPSADYESPRHHAEACERARSWQETLYIVDGVYVTVGEIDAHFGRARAAGARILSELEENAAAGQRQYRAEDPEGHRWMFAQPMSSDAGGSP